MNRANQDKYGTRPPVPPPPPTPDRRPPPLPDQAGLFPADPANAPSARPTAAKLAGAPTSDSSLGNPEQLFAEQARYILAEERGFTPKCEALLEAAARELGLASDRAAEVLDRLRQPPPVMPPPAPGAAVLVPAETAPQDSPRVMFQAYVQEALRASSRDVVRESKEQRLIEEGSRNLGLSSTLARQIVHQVARQLGKEVESRNAESEAALEPSLDHPRLAEFLRRAQAILAEQRGINARSRMLLSASASEMGLTEQQTEQAIALLQESSKTDSEEDRWRRERIESFRSFLVKEVSRLKQRVVTSRMRQRWIEDADLHHGVDEADAAKVIRELLAAEQVQLVSEDQACEHVAALVAELLGDAQVLEDDIRVRVFAEGSQWGLSPMQVDEIVQDRIRQNHRRSSIWKAAILVSVVFGLGAICILASVLILIRMSEAPASAPIDAPTVTEADNGLVPTTEISEDKASRWWTQDENTLIAVTKFRGQAPDQMDLLEQICQSDPEPRSLAYRQLVAAAWRSSTNPVLDGLFQELIVACYAADPDEQAVGAIRQSLLSFVPAKGDTLPADEAGFDEVFWSMRAVLSLLLSPATPVDRREELARELESQLHTAVDPALERGAVERQLAAAVHRHLLSVVIAGAAKDPLPAAHLFMLLDRQARRYLQPAELDQARVKLLAVAVPAAGKQWRDYEPLLTAAIGAEDPLVVLKVVELMEQASDEHLQQFLAGQLLIRVGQPPNAISASDAARRVREAFGVQQAVTGEARWKQLVQSATVRIAEPPAKADAAPLDILQETLDYALLGTKACALAQGDLGYATYDELVQQTGIQLSLSTPAPRSSSGNRRPSAPAARMQLQNVLRFIQYLAEPQRRPAHRAVYLRGLASIAANVPQIEREPATELAEYLLSSKPEEEHRLVLEHITSLSHWRNVRLAMADLVSETPLDQERVQPMVEALLGRTLMLDEENWKQRSYEALLQSVIDDLSFEATREAGDEKIYDQASEALRELYAVRARLVGVATQNYGNLESPAAVLRAIALAAATRLEGSPSATALQNGILPELNAIDYLCEDDIQRTVAMQRLCMQLLSRQVSRERPERAVDATAIEAWLAARDTAATNVLTQLRDGEQALLQMWMLWSPRDGGKIPIADDTP